MPIEFHIKRGDLEPAIEGVLKRIDATGIIRPVDLTGAVRVKFAMKLKDAKIPKVDAPASIISPEAGVVRYTWQPGDTDTVGIYKAEWQVEWPGGRLETFPSTDDPESGGYIKIIIREDIATP
jgi:hypothetical protein